MPPCHLPWTSRTDQNMQKTHCNKTDDEKAKMASPKKAKWANRTEEETTNTAVLKKWANKFEEHHKNG